MEPFPGLLTATFFGIAKLAERLAQDLESGLAELIKVYTIVAAHEAFYAKSPVPWHLGHSAKTAGSPS